MSNLLVRNARLLVPSRGMDETGDLLVEKGLVARIGKRTDPPKGKGARTVVVDGTGLWAAPGLVDPHVHLREPGYEYKETIATGTAAAAAGGFTSVVCMANTNPVNDNAAVTRFIARRAAEAGNVKVFPAGAVTVGLAGETLAEMVDMRRAGCAAFSDDGRPIMNSFILRRAMEYLRYLNVPLISHSEDAQLAAGGACHEGRVSVPLGLRGIPSAAEEAMVARDIVVARLTRGRLHVAHLSTRGALRMIALAREDGLAVTAEVTPHHLFLTDEAVSGFDTNAKVSPPLRDEDDRQALIEGLTSGIIDCVASDHAPHGLVDKQVEFDQAACGISGLETSLALCLKLVHGGLLTPLQLIERMSTRPADLMGLPAGDLIEGGPADLVLIDPGMDWTVKPEDFLSLGKNSPFGGWALKGRAVMTFVDGREVWRHPSMADRAAG